MKITRLKIKNMFGITEQELDGRSMEITGTNGVGKSSIIDAIRYALENKSNRDCIIRQGAKEGEIILETDGELSIHRKVREDQADYKSIKMNKKPISKPEAFLDSIFSPLQLDPVEFTRMNKNDQNRAILNLIEFNWDKNYIIDKFGELPPKVDYDQHILKVLYDIQDENGFYFKTRQDINRDIHTNENEAQKIALKLPEGYNPATWRNYDISSKYEQLNKIKDHNDKINRAKIFADGYKAKAETLELNKNSKIRDIEAIAKMKVDSVNTTISDYEKSIQDLKIKYEKEIQDLNHRIELEKTQFGKLEDDKKAQIQLANSEYEKEKIKLDKDNEIAVKWANEEVKDTSELEKDIAYINEMRTFVTEGERLQEIDATTEHLKEKSKNLTNKIELARTLPAEILKTAKLPIKGLTIVNGEPRINLGNGPLPVNSLSEGEQLDLCVDVALCKSSNLEIILIDGIERLSEANRNRLYQKCKDKGLQFIATRTTDSKDMEIVYL